MSRLSDQIERARQFLADHPDSPVRPEVQSRLDEYLKKLDERDIERARDYSRQNSTQFATRIERYQDYLKAHQAGGRYISEAIEAKDRILREWDTYAYRQAYDHLVAHPDDVAEVARRLRDYLRDHPEGRYADHGPSVPRLVGQGLRARPVPRAVCDEARSSRTSASTSRAAGRIWASSSKWPAPFMVPRP